MTNAELEALVRAHGVEVYRYLKYLAADHALAEDLAQETFVSALESRNHPPAHERERCRAWLRAIARNRFLWHCRRHRRNPVVVNSDLLERAEDVWRQKLADAGGLRRALAALEHCLRRLPESRRRLLDMRYARDMGREEMARELGMRPDGVKTALRRLRLQLAECMAANRGSEE